MELVEQRLSMRRAGRLAAALALAAALFVLGGIGVFRSSEGDERPGTARPISPALLAPRPASGSLAAAIGELQARVRDDPTDWRSLASLGAAYVQQARITADPSYYPKAEGVLDRSLSVRASGNFQAYVGRGALEAARHDFAAALRDGERAARINPYSADVYGVIGDAELELGRYRDAIGTYQRMVDTEPNLSSYARVSYARELQGDVRGAVAAMRLAQQAAGTQADAAWASYQLGELAFNDGDVRRAAAGYRRALELDPSFVPPRAGMAKVAWARGDVDRAIAGYERVTEIYPAPEYVIALGDLYELAGRTGLAAEQADLVRAEERLFEASGVDVDLEIALYEADHGDPAAAVRAARDEWARRHSVHVADALGWALYADGRYREAKRFATRAMRLGTRNASFLYHAGMIRLRLGDRRGARRLLGEALAINPHFSILGSPVAERALQRLAGGR